MRLNIFLLKAYPWIGLFGSLCLIIPSLLNVIGKPLELTDDHIVLAAGIFLMIVFLKEIFDRIANLKGMK
jgi:hypothetical protein